MSEKYIPLVSGSKWETLKPRIDGEGFLAELKQLFDKYGIKQIRPYITPNEEPQLGYITDWHVARDKHIPRFGMTNMEIVPKKKAKIYRTFIEEVKPE